MIAQRKTHSWMPALAIIAALAFVVEHTTQHLGHFGRAAGFANREVEQPLPIPMVPTHHLMGLGVKPHPKIIPAHDLRPVDDMREDVPHADPHPAPHGGEELQEAVQADAVG